MRDEQYSVRAITFANIGIHIPKQAARRNFRCAACRHECFYLFIESGVNTLPLRGKLLFQKRAVFARF